MSWSESLIRIAGYEVEVLQKRLAGVVDRRIAAEAAVARLDLEATVEAAAAEAAADPFAHLAHASYAKAWRARREQADAAAARVREEEAGARDALNAAFEQLKKFEHVAERARLAELAAAGRRETAALDEIALRRAAAR